MEVRIATLTTKKLVGKRMQMSLANNQTFQLWRSFQQQRKLIKHQQGKELYSMQIYDASQDFTHFNPTTTFEKWATVEVTTFEAIPEGMETFVLDGGLYAVFIHIGAAPTFQKTFQYIFYSWLPNSDYELDQRPHFEVLGEKYKNNDPNSEEEVWIPIKLKGV